MPLAPLVPDHTRVYCIGDIHGRLDLLTALHAEIDLDVGPFAGDRLLVYLGDYIDRGNDSKGVIDYLLSKPMQGFQPIYLLGNHEQALMDFLKYPRHAKSWLHFGGIETLRSYGVRVHPEDPRQLVEDIRDELVESIPPAHVSFLESLLHMFELGNYCFVHAGIRPGIALQEQRNSDLLWIREDFTDSDEIHERIIVHGHTISKQPEMLPNRIGIDTGAFATGVLTCLVLEGHSQRLLQTGASGV